MGFAQRNSIAGSTNLSCSDLHRDLRHFMPEKKAIALIQNNYYEEINM